MKDLQGEYKEKRALDDLAHEESNRDDILDKLAMKLGNPLQYRPPVSNMLLKTESEIIAIPDRHQPSIIKIKKVFTYDLTYYYSRYIHVIRVVVVVSSVYTVYYIVSTQ